MPLVSVVVIGYNDVTHLPTAIRSVQRQTFKDLEIFVVDDASTDGTADVAEEFARADARIRVIRLDTNSGGCSRPRNVGLESATGRYVFFLDSDDEVPRGAIGRLVAAAERSKADLACGRWVRRHHHPRRMIPAHDELYARARTVAAITDEPRLLYDTPAWNKLYRRSLIEGNGLQFPEGMLYEDLLFTTEAYCAANRITLVPDIVYVWHVRRQVESLSITNRGDLRAWRDRFEAHRQIDAFLADHSAGAALLDAKHGKFLDLDFVLFLRDLRQTPAADRAALFELATRYVRTLPEGSAVSATPAVRAAMTATSSGDLAHTLEAADWVVAGSSPFGVVRRALVTNSRVRLDGEIRQPVGEPAPQDGKATLALQGRLGGVLARSPATVEHTVDGIEFHADVDLARLGARLLSPRTGPEIRFALLMPHARGQTTVPLIARDADLPPDEIRTSTPWRAITGDRLRLTERNGRFVALLSALPPATDAAIDLAGRARNRVHRWRLRLRLGQPSRSESAS